MVLQIPSDEELESTPYYFGQKPVIFTRKGWELCFAPEPLIALVGGFGSSKTFAGICRATRLLTWYPGNLGIIGRYAATDLAGTTRHDCLKFWREANLLDDFVLKHKEYAVPTATLKCVDPYTQEILPGKYSDAIFIHFDDPSHTHGHHAGFFWMDEANQCQKLAFDELVSRLRRPGFKGLYSGWLTSNTNLGYDFIYRAFKDPEELKKMKPAALAARRFIHSTTYENRKNLPPDYIENMENTYSEKMCRVYLMGSYESFEGQMFEEWDEAIHVIDVKECFPDGIPSEWKRLLAVDPGGTDPWAWEFAAVDPYSNVIIYDEIYGKGNTVEPFARKALPKIRKYPNWQAMVIDSENKVAAGELAEHGIICTNAQKQNKLGDRNSSFYRVSGYMHPNPDHGFPAWHPRKGDKGSPRLFVGSNCTFLRKEIPQQRWKQNKQTGLLTNEADPLVDNHATDCLMYLIRERPDPVTLEKGRLYDLSKNLSKMSILMHDATRKQKEEVARLRWNVHMGHGRGAHRPSRRIV